MSKFTKFYFSLLEGGNVRLGGIEMGGNVTVDEIGADKIEISKMSEKESNNIKLEISSMLKSFNETFIDENDEELWPNLELNIDIGDLFSGSTRLFFTKPHKEFIKFKKIVGDIDIMYPIEKKDKLENFIKNQVGNKFGNLTLVGMGGNSPIQFNTLFELDGKNIQFDFEPTYWIEGVPSKFSRFSHYSSWKDIKSNIKGVFAKFLIRALIGREKLGNIAVITKTGKISKSEKFDNPGMKGFSVDKGVRVKFSPILDDKGQIKKTEDGRPMYRETDSKTVSYERGMDKIFQMALGEFPTKDEKNDFHSFIGILNLMKKFMSDEEVQDVFDKFMEIIWDESAQEIETGKINNEGIQTNDFKVKKYAYDAFVKVFPFLKMSEKDLKDYVKPLYSKLEMRREE